MAKFAVAKENIEKLVVAALGNDYITTQDKKIYAWADDGGERVQIAISLTGVKNQVGAAQPPVSNLVQSEELPPWETAPAPTPVETPKGPTKEEEDNLAAMLAKFGL